MSCPNNYSCRFSPRRQLLLILSVLLCGFTSAAQTPKLSTNPAATATVYLDFDGHTVEGTPWNWESTIHAKSSKLGADTITEIYNRVKEDYEIFDINITTDSTVYERAPVARRVRIIITPTYEWYGEAAGVAYVNSFNWADGTPAWVFSSQLSNNPKFIGEATSHEIGHTLGLQHQSTYDKDCGLVTEYAEGRGSGETGWAPIMGTGYYKNLTTWTVGTSILGCDSIQDDIAVISHGEQNIPLVKDDYGDNLADAAPVNSNGNSFRSTGIITNETDRDYFRLSLSTSSVLKVEARPGNISTNIDILLCLLNSDGDTLLSANPAKLVSAAIDTNLKKGTYYLAVDGVGNENVNDYASTGYYTLSGSLDAILPVIRLELNGTVSNATHVLNWIAESSEPVLEAVMESSADGILYKTCATLSPAVTHYINRPWGYGTLYYRIRMITAGEERPYYSNVVVLNTATGVEPELYSNLISSMITVSSRSSWTYHLLDETGRLLERGQINPGVNSIPATGIRKGLFLLRLFNGYDRKLFRLIKQ